MKFQNVPVGAKIFDGQYLLIKFRNIEINDNDDNNVISIENGLSWHIGDNKEVKLITNCANCRFLDKNFNKHTPLNMLNDEGNFCHKIGITVDASEYYCLNQDPETFSCSNFEMKGE